MKFSIIHFIVLVLLIALIIDVCVRVHEPIHSDRIQHERQTDDLSLREKILLEEIRQLKALIPSNVTVTVDIAKLIEENNK